MPFQPQPVAAEASSGSAQGSLEAGLASASEPGKEGPGGETGKQDRRFMLYGPTDVKPRPQVGTHRV